MMSSLSVVVLILNSDFMDILYDTGVNEQSFEDLQTIDY